MQSNDLTRDQARALKNKLHPMLGYLARVKRRMVRRGFLNDDPLLAAVVRAEDAMHALHVEVHYLGCDSGVGRERRRSRRTGKLACTFAITEQTDRTDAEQ